MRTEKDLFTAQYTDDSLKTNETSRFIGSKYFRTRNEVAYEVISRLPRGSGLLDYGCGQGDLCMKFNEHCDSVLGADILETNIELARAEADRRRITNVEFQTCSVEGTREFSNGQFEYVTCVATLGYIYDIYGQVTDFHRIIKKNGYLLIQVANLAYFRNRLKLLFGIQPVTSPVDSKSWKEVGWDVGCLHYFTESKLRELLLNCGFEIISVDCSGAMSYIRSFKPSFLGGDLIILARKNK